MNLEELERAAMCGDPLPDGLCQPDQLLYLAMRILYREYRAGAITRESAKLEKGKLLSEYGQARYWYDVFWKAARRQNRLAKYLTEIEKNGCEQCRKAVRIFDGREQFAEGENKG